MEYGRGSSSSTGVLAESIRLGTAPLAIVLAEADMIVMLGALVAHELYGKACPVVVANRTIFDSLATGKTVTILGDAMAVSVSAAGP
jgi:predicted aconitase with swiveling domain